MYVLPKDRYKALVGKSQSSPIQSPSTPNDSQSTTVQSPVSLCPVCGLDFKNSNILAHHMKSHVAGHKCNICGKIFKSEGGLRKHLIMHGPQAEPPPDPPRIGPVSRPEPIGPSKRLQHEELHCSVCDKKVNHKRNLSRHMRIHKNTLKFKATKWETLS